MIFDLEPFLQKYGIPHNPSKRGNQMIPCPNPAHEDTHPSTSIHLDKGVWNCQACGEGGSAVDLVMIVEGVELVEAIKRAESIGGSRPDDTSPKHSATGLPSRKGPPVKRPPVSPWAGFR